MDAPQRTITGIATVGVPVTDQDRALRFYTETVGMEKRLDVPLPQFGGRWITVASPASTTTLALIPAHDGVPAGVETGIRLASPDAAAAHQHLRERGADVGELLHAKEQLQALRTSPALRIAVTVDMIATGTDVKPLECVFFMRDVRSAQYFEQMKGRGARTITSADFQAVTPDAENKTRFVIVDAVEVTEHDFIDPPLNREKSVTLKKLLEKAAGLSLSEDEAATLASRLAKLELNLTDVERGELDGVAGQPVRDIIRQIVDSVDPVTTTPERIARATEPIASNPELRSRILELRATHDRVIDEVSKDELVEAGGVVDTERARSIVESWQAYLDEHRDEITAVQLVYEAGEQRIDFTSIQELAARIARPPHNWTPDIIWNAYAAIDSPKVRNTPTHTLTDLVSLIRSTTGMDAELVPYADRVRDKYAVWLAQQKQTGVVFTETERWWLDRMTAIVANSAGIRVEDLDDAPFAERGGAEGAIRDLGDRAADLIEELNAKLTA